MDKPEGIEGDHAAVGHEADAHPVNPRPVELQAPPGGPPADFPDRTADDPVSDEAAPLPPSYLKSSSPPSTDPSSDPSTGPVFALPDDPPPAVEDSAASEGPHPDPPAPPSFTTESLFKAPARSSGPSDPAPAAPAASPYAQPPALGGALDAHADGEAAAEKVQRLLALIIADLDHRMATLLGAVIRHPRFQALEARWRGLAYLVEVRANLRLAEKTWKSPLQDADRGHQRRERMVQVRMLDATWAELKKDIDRHIDSIHRSDLFRLLDERYFDYPGAAAFNLIVVDHEALAGTPQRPARGDTETLGGLARIGGNVFCPFVMGLSPHVFGHRTFGDISHHTTWDRLASASESYTQLKRLGRRPEASFLGLVAPRMLARRPWRDGGLALDFAFTEPPGGLWMTGGYALGATALRAFDEAGWFAHVRGAPRDRETGGLIPVAAVDDVQTDSPGLIPRPVTDLILTMEWEQQLSDLGLIGITRCWDTERVAFFSLPSLRQPDPTHDVRTAANARLAAQLTYTLSACRVGHCVKAIIRNELGTAIDITGLQGRLTEWLNQYRVANLELPDKPLKDAEVVLEPSNRTGYYRCRLMLQPHFMLDRFALPVNLQTDFAMRQ